MLNGCRSQRTRKPNAKSGSHAAITLCLCLRRTDLDRRESRLVMSLGRMLAQVIRVAISAGLAEHWGSVPVGRRSASPASVPAGPPKVHPVPAETTAKHCPTGSCYRKGTRMEYLDKELQRVDLD